MTTTQTQPRRRNNDVERNQAIENIVYGEVVFGTRDNGVILDTLSQDYNVRYNGDWFGGTYPRAYQARAVLDTLPPITPTPETGAEEFPDNLPLKTPDFLEAEKAEAEKAEIAVARRACFAAARDGGLSTDSDSMKAAYLDYFQHFGGASRSLWTAAMWRKMTNAILGGVWKSQNGCWVRVHQYTGQIARRNGVEMKPIERKVT